MSHNSKFLSAHDQSFHTLATKMATNKSTCQTNLLEIGEPLPDSHRTCHSPLHSGQPDGFYSVPLASGYSFTGEDDDWVDVSTPENSINHLNVHDPSCDDLYCFEAEIVKRMFWDLLRLGLEFVLVLLVILYCLHIMFPRC